MGPNADQRGSRAPGDRTVPTRRHDPLEGIDADGMIVTGATRTAIPAVFESVLAEVVEAVPGDVSVYVYGSVATGQAVPGSSDVDLLTVGLAASQADEISSRLSGVHAELCRGVEIGAAQVHDFVGEHDEAYGNRAFVRHYCVHLAGPALAVDATYPADRRAARGFNGDIARHAERWRRELTTREPAELARIVARKTLLAVAGLVSVHDRIWTTDRRLAAQRWAEIDPSSAGAMRVLFAWTRAAPGVSRTDVQHVLDTTIPTVTARFERDIGLWQS